MVYAYLRVSTKGQVERFGLDVQENEIKKYCADNGLALDSVFADEGISGALGDNESLEKRQAMIELLNTVDTGDTVIVLNKSRLWRDDEARIIIIKEFRKAQINLISLQEPTYSLYSKDPSDMLINGILDILDTYERLIIVRRMNSGKKEKMKTGVKPAGTLPYGYRFSEDKKSIEIYEPEAAIIKEMFSAYRRLQGYGKVARYLNSVSLTLNRPAEWTRQIVYKMMHNDFYVGIMRYGAVTKGSHKPIISEELWEELYGVTVDDIINEGTGFNETEKKMIAG